MRAWGKHGAEALERERPQPIDLDVTLESDFTPALGSDDVRDAIDYAAVYRICAHVVSARSFALLESLAAACVAEVMKDERVARATVRVRKPRLLDGATPEVEVSRDRGGSASTEP